MTLKEQIEWAKLYFKAVWKQSEDEANAMKERHKEIIKKIKKR